MKGLPKKLVEMYANRTRVQDPAYLGYEVHQGKVMAASAMASGLLALLATYAGMDNTIEYIPYFHEASESIKDFLKISTSGLAGIAASALCAITAKNIVDNNELSKSI